jgi:hypothetical protein
VSRGAAAAATIAGEIAALRNLTVKQLQERYAALFGEAARSGNKQWLFKRIAWKLQEKVYGGISERAKRRAAEILDESVLCGRADRRALDALVAAPPAPPPVAPRRDPRLPPAGAVIARTYQGRELRVLVLDDGFELEGARYRSLSAIAKKVTGTAWNGLLFFGLAKRGAKEA